MEIFIPEINGNYYMNTFTSTTNTSRYSKYSHLKGRKNFTLAQIALHYYEILNYNS